MRCQRCGQIAEFELDFFDYGKAKFLCFNCKLCGHYSDSVDLQTIDFDTEDEITRFMKGESLLAMLDTNTCKRKAALREVIRRRLKKLVVTVRSQNNYYLERLNLKDLL